MQFQGPRSEFESGSPPASKPRRETRSPRRPRIPLLRLWNRHRGQLPFTLLPAAGSLERWLDLNA